MARRKVTAAAPVAPEPEPEIAAVEPAVETPPPGPVSLFRRKVRKPVTLTLTPEHHIKVNAAMHRLGISRADVIALLIDQYADNVGLGV